MEHLGDACVPANADPQALFDEWMAAKARLGPPIPNAGQPDIQPLPAAATAHVQQLQHAVWAAPLFQAGGLTPPKFGLVEVDPLIAFQLTVATTRSDFHCGSLSNPPTLDEMLRVCLPLTAPSEQFNVQRQANSMIIKARSLNLRLQDAGMFNAQFAGVAFGPALPFVQVVRLDGRYYLFNGFHRACGLRRAGATHIPCAVRDALDPSIAATIQATFSQALLEGDDPPTLAHYTQGRAHDVALRLTSRVIHVTWSEWVVLDD